MPKFARKETSGDLPPHLPYSGRTVWERFGPKSYLFLASIWGHYSCLRDVTYLDNNVDDWKTVNENSPVDLPDSLLRFPRRTAGAYPADDYQRLRGCRPS